MRQFLIGTGYYANQHTAETAKTFSSHWFTYNAQAPVVVVDNAPVGLSPEWQDNCRVIKLHENLGRFERIYGLPDIMPGSPMLCGWSVSWILPCWIAYSEYRDFLYIEQDCLCCGDWLCAITDEIEAGGKAALFGQPSGGQASEISFFWISRDFIPGFVRLYLSSPGDNRGIIEKKVQAIIQENSGLVGFHSIGTGRSRPIPVDGPISVQQLTDDELRWLVNERKK